MIGESHDGLAFRFIRDLRAAKNDFDVWTQSFQQGYDLGGLLNIPNIDAKADDARLTGQQGLDDLQRLLVDDEFEHAGAITQLPEVRHEVAEPEGGVNVFRVERGEDDVRHARACWRVSARGARMREDGVTAFSGFLRP